MGLAIARKEQSFFQELWGPQNNSVNLDYFFEESQYCLIRYCVLAGQALFLSSARGRHTHFFQLLGYTSLKSHVKSRCCTHLNFFFSIAIQPGKHAKENIERKCKYQAEKRKVWGRFKKIIIKKHGRGEKGVRIRIPLLIINNIWLSK